MKKFLFLLLTALMFGSGAWAQARTFQQSLVVKNRAVIGTETSYAALADTSCWLQIGIADSSRRGAILFKWTDSTSVGVRKKNGLMIYNKVDSNFWYYNGRKWKKVGS